MKGDKFIEFFESYNLNSFISITGQVELRVLKLIVKKMY